MSRVQRLPGGGARFLVVAASLIVVIAGLRQAGQVILPFLTATFLAVISLPFMTWLQRKKVPTVVAVLLTVAVAAGVVSALAMVVGQSVNEFAQVVAESQYNERLEEQANRMREWAEGVGLPVADWSPLDYVNPEAVVNLLGGTLGALAGLLQNAFLVLLAVIFILVEAAGFRAKLRLAFGEDSSSLERFSQITRQVQNYLAVKTAVSLSTGFLAWTWCYTLGLEFPLMWGVVAFIFNYIPNIGSIVAAVGPVLLALVTFEPGRAVAVAAGYVVINIIFGNFVEPTLLGRRLGLSVLVVFLSLVFWGWVWGPMGMLLAVPLTMSLKISLENTKDLRWIAVLLDANPARVVVKPSPTKAAAVSAAPSDV